MIILIISTDPLLSCLLSHWLVPLCSANEITEPGAGPWPHLIHWLCCRVSLDLPRAKLGIPLQPVNTLISDPRKGSMPGGILGCRPGLAPQRPPPHHHRSSWFYLLPSRCFWLFYCLPMMVSFHFHGDVIIQLWHNNAAKYAIEVCYLKWIKLFIQCIFMLL